MEKIDYNSEINICINSINNCIDEIVATDNDLKSFSILKKLNLQKKYIRGLRKFRELGVELHKKNNGIYAFFIDGDEYNYSIKTKKIKRPGWQEWNMIQEKTLEKILNKEMA